MTTTAPWCDNDLTMVCGKCNHGAGRHTHNSERCCGTMPNIFGTDCACDGFQKPLSSFIKKLPTPPGAGTGKKSTTKKGHTMAETANSKKEKSSVSGDTYPLPNGDTYYARNMGGFKNDVEGLRELVNAGTHVLALGEPGTGKTALMMAAFPDAENEIGHSKMQAWDMLWRPRPLPDGSIIFDPAPLTRAATKGCKLYIDEIMRLGDDGFTPLFSGMDGRGFIVGGNLDGTDLPVAPGFGVVGASNPLVRGAFLPDAIASRFHIINIETSIDLLEALEIDERLLVIWRNLGQLSNGEVWKPSIREMKAANKFLADDNNAQAAYALTGWRVPARDRETVSGVVGTTLGVRAPILGGTIK